jgi:hypothetical protein
MKRYYLPIEISFRTLIHWLLIFQFLFSTCLQSQNTQVSKLHVSSNEQNKALFDLPSFASMNPTYRPLICLPCNQYEYSQQAYLFYKLPILDQYYFLNIKLSFGENEPIWFLKNIPLAPYPNPTPMRIMLDLQSITEQPTLPPILQLEWTVTSIQLVDASWTGELMNLEALPFPICIGSGGTIGYHPLFQSFPILPEEPILPIPPISGHLRGCEVPNIDLDSLAYPIDPDAPSSHDHLACGPAAAANSLHWLEDMHDQIEIDGDIRQTLDTLKKMMSLDTISGVNYQNFIKGKLAFIDKYKLPIRVKFQTHFPLTHIESPNPLYGSKAENKSPSDNHPTYDWLKNELEEDEDVEILYGYYCDTLVMDTITVDGVVKDTFKIKLKRRGGHYVNVTGYIQIGNRKYLTFKHDPRQSGEGGTSDENGDPITDLSEWIEDTKGYAYLKSKTIKGCTTYVETVVSESFDAEVTFCQKKVTSPEDSGEGTLRDAIACAKNGEVILIDPLLADLPIILNSGSLFINYSVTIMADPDMGITIQAGDQVDRVFDIAPEAQINLSGLTLKGGIALEGNVIYNAGKLILDNVITLNNPNIQTSLSGIYNNSTGQLEILNQTRIKK